MPEWATCRRRAAAALALVAVSAPAAADQPSAAAPDPGRGAAIVSSRAQGLCALCHAVPGVPAQQTGNLGPDLAGVGARLDAQALRQRLLAPERSNPDTLMPSYARTEGLRQVTAARAGRPLLDAQQIADVLAYLGTLQ